MGEPLLSIITVCRDDAYGLRRTLQSFAGLNHDRIETIVIDGSDGDDCASVESAFRGAITVYVHGPDRGLYHAMNKGVARARGHGFLFVNAGDEIYNAQRLNQLVAHCGTDLGRKLHFGGHVQAIGPHFLPVQAQLLTPEGIAQGIVPSHQEAILPAGFSKANPYDEGLRFLSDAKLLKRAFSELEHIRLDALLVVVEHGGISSFPGSWLSVLRHCREAMALEKPTPVILGFMVRVLARKIVAALLGGKKLEAIQIARALRRAHRSSEGGGLLGPRSNREELTADL